MARAAAHAIVFDLDQTLSARKVSKQKSLNPAEKLTELKKSFEAAGQGELYRPPLEFDFENNCRFSDAEKIELVTLLKQHFMGRVGICTNSNLTPAEIQNYLEINFGVACAKLGVTVRELFPQTLMRNGHDIDEDKTQRLCDIQTALELSDTEKQNMLFIDDNAGHVNNAIRNGGIPSFCFHENCKPPELFAYITNTFLANPLECLREQQKRLPPLRAVPFLMGSTSNLGGLAARRRRLASASAADPQSPKNRPPGLFRQTSAPTLPLQESTEAAAAATTTDDDMAKPGSPQTNGNATN